MKKLLIGSTNSGKVASYRSFLSHERITIVTPDDVGIHEEYREEGRSFEEISRNKALFYAHLSNLPCIADDGGLEIDALNDEPGIYSRRWPGYEASDIELVRYALKRMKNIPFERRGASLGGVITLAFPSGKCYHVEIAIRGIISEKLERPVAKGLPYRSLFWIPELSKYYTDLTPDELEQRDHRKQGLDKLRVYLIS